MPASASTCPECGAVLRARLAHGLCPRCVLRVTLAEDAAAVAGLDLCDSPDSARRFGHYELLRELGRGGMGIVYEARHASLNRVVALKMLHPTRLASPAQLQRFRQEAEAVAALDHPAILPIYDVGDVQGQPYFTMKLAPGGSLADDVRAPERQTDASGSRSHQAAAWVAAVARAIHCAHQHGIQHRDLKPGNILLDLEGRPYVTDFGLAKFTDRASGLTLSTETLGSPAYMSPEQATGDSKNLTTASDIYALGAVLFELLTGRPPFAAENVPALLRRIVEEEPDASAIADRDLRTITLKCLSKDPQKRYPSAEAVAQELDRWQAGEPILARPVSETERILRWCRRRPALAAAVGSLILTLVGGIVGITLQWRRAEDQSRHREVERYAADMQLASHAVESHDLGLARRLLAAQVPQPGDRDHRGLEWRLLEQLCRGDHRATLAGHTATVTCVALSPDGHLAASGGMDSAVIIWNLATQTMVTNLQAHRGVVWSVGFTPDGERLITAGADGKVRFWTRAGLPAEPPLDGQNAALSRNGTRLAASMSSPFRYFNAQRGLKVWDWKSRRVVFETNAAVRRVALSTDGRWLAAGGERRDLFLWNLDTGEARRIDTVDTPWALAFSPDGSQLAAAGFNLGARLWSLNAPASAPVALLGHQYGVWGIAFAPDGRRVVTCGSDRTIQIRELAALDHAAVLAGHSDEVWDVAWNADGKSLATASKDMTVRLWPDRPATTQADWPNRDHWLPHFSRDGSWLLTLQGSSGQRTDVILRDLSNGVVLAQFDSRWVAGFGTNGADVLLLNDETYRVETWQAATKQLLPGPTLQSPPPGPSPRHFALSADGRTLALASASEIILWNTADGLCRGRVPLPKDYPLLALALSPRAEYLAFTATAPYTIALHNLRTGRVRTLTNHTEEVKGLAFSPDGRHLASAGVDRVIRLWDTDTGRLRGELVSYFEEASGVAFSPDGRLLASIGVNQAVKLWHLATQREVLSLPVSDARQCIAFSPTGDALAFTAETDRVRILRVETPEPPTDHRRRGGVSAKRRALWP